MKLFTDVKLSLCNEFQSDAMRIISYLMKDTYGVYRVERSWVQSDMRIFQIQTLGHFNFLPSPSLS